MRAWTRSVCVWLIIAQVATPVWAGPLGGSVAAGQATIGGAGAVTEVRQSTDRAIVNWQSFSTAAHESVRFVQPSAASVTLNRVTGNSASALNGGMSANGRVFISNPNGIHFGSTSRVNVGSLVASTLAISNDDFMRGNHRLTDSGRAPAAVVNDGHITAAPGGSVALVAPVVANHGTIEAPGGRVTLAAGAGAQVDLDSGLVRLEASGAAPRDVVAGTDGNANPLAQVVNNGALVEAGGVVESNGRVILKSAEGLAVNDGAIVAKHVTIDSTQASVLTAGSVVRATDTAKVLSHGHAASLAGSVVEVPEGFIEVSGRKLSLRGRLDTRGENGRAGRLLIDPEDLVINDSPDCGNDRTISTVEIAAQAQTNGRVTLRAESTITFQNSILPVDLRGADLTLEILPGPCSAGLGIITAAAGSFGITGVDDFTIHVGEANNPVAVGRVDLSGIQLQPFLGDVTVDVFGDTTACVRLGNVLAPAGTISVSSSGSIAGVTGGALGLVATNVTLSAPVVGTSAVPVLVSATNQLSLRAGTELFVNNTTVANTLSVQVQDVLTNGVLVTQCSGKSVLQSVGSGQITFCNTSQGSDLNFTLAGVGKNLCITACMGSFDLLVEVADGRLDGTVNAIKSLSLTSLGLNSGIDVINQSDAENLTVHVRQATVGAFAVCQGCSSISVGANGVTGTSANVRVISDDGEIALAGLQAGGRIEIEARGGDILMATDISTTGEFVLKAQGDILSDSQSNALVAPSVTLEAGGKIGDGGSGIFVVDASNQLNLTVGSTDGIAAFLITRPQSLNITLAGPGTPITIQDLGEDVLLADAGGPLRTNPCNAPLTCETKITQLTGDLRVGTIDAEVLHLTSTLGKIVVESGEVLTASDLRLQAATGIETNDRSPVRIDVEELTANSGTGTIFLREADGLLVRRARVVNGGSIDIATDAGSIDIDLGIDANQVKLTAGPGGSISSQGGTVTANDADLIADGDLNLCGVNVSGRLHLETRQACSTIAANLVGTPDRLEVDFVSGTALGLLDAASGDAVLVALANGGVRSKGVLDLDVDITVRQGDFQVGQAGLAIPFASSRDISIRVPDGRLSILDGVPVRASDLLLASGTGVSATSGGPAVVQSDSLIASAVNGNVNLAALGDARLLTSFAGGDFTLTSSGDLSVAGDVTAGGALSLTAANALVDTGATDHVLAGACATLFGRNLGLASRPLTVAAPQLDLLATGNAFVRSRVAVNAGALTAAGDLALQGLADITVGSLAGATVQVQSFGGRILDGNGAANNVTAIGGTAGFFATAGIGTAADAIETNASAIIARTTGGDISLAEANDVLLTASAAGDLRVSSDGGWLVLNGVTAGGRAELRAAAGGLLDANGAAVNVTAQSLLAVLADSAGTVDDALELAVGSLDATAFGVFVEVNGPLRVDQLTSTFTNRIRATGDVTLGRLASSQGIVDVISVNGSILDGNGAAANLVVASAGENRLIAGGTIGAADALEVQVGFLTIAAGGAAGAVSASIDGTVTPFDFVNILEAPGAVLFNGRVQGTGAPVVAETPEAAQLRTADPAQSLAASISAQGNPSAADAAGSSTEGPREPSDLIDSSAAND